LLEDIGIHVSLVLGELMHRMMEIHLQHYLLRMPPSFFRLVGTIYGWRAGLARHHRSGGGGGEFG